MAEKKGKKKERAKPKYFRKFEKEIGKKKKKKAPIADADDTESTGVRRR